MERQEKGEHSRKTERNETERARGRRKRSGSAVGEIRRDRFIGNDARPLQQGQSTRRSYGVSVFIGHHESPRSLLSRKRTLYALSGFLGLSTPLPAFFLSLLSRENGANRRVVKVRRHRGPAGAGANPPRVDRLGGRRSRKNWISIA